MFSKYSLIIVLFFSGASSVSAQLLFSEECFAGGVLTGGVDTAGSIMGVQCDIDWQSDDVLRRAYAATYRYGRPEPYAQSINGAPVWWDLGSQAGPEQIETNELSQYFAPHIVEITDLLSINSNQLLLDLPSQPSAGNMGWWGVYVVVLYQSPNITTNVCIRHYTADQSQLGAQNYSIETPPYDPAFPVVFGIHSGRLADWFPDRTRISINNATVGEIWQPDLVQPFASSGVQGHFSYRDGEVLAFNGDTANSTLNRHDGTAVINEYLTSNSVQSIRFQPNLIPPQANPNPSFVIAYTPSCPLANGEMPRAYTFCRGDSVQFTALPGYDYYAWTPEHQLSDSTLANPICFADSSRWYRVRMWNDDETGACAQTIPVFVTVGQIPRPGTFTVNASSCPNATGRIRMEEMHGTTPFQYTVGTKTKAVGNFEQLAAGTYPVSIVDALGCTWDTVAVVQLNVPHNAAFTANPQEGDSPLDVHLTNQSTNPTPGSMTYQWLIDNALFSTNTNTQVTFPDTGTYTVSLIAILGNPACADTAEVTIRVNPGIRIVLPNIFTPNGDAQNDKLVAELFGVSKLSWEIYNRWGNLIHSGANNSGEGYVELWDGREASAGVYVVILTGTGLNGKPIAIQGTVNLGR